MTSSSPRGIPGLLEIMNGRPVILHDGQPVSQASYCDYILRGDWEERNREFVESGVKVFHLTAPHGGPDFFTSAFWTDEGVYHAEDTEVHKFPLKRQAETILAMQPDARFILHLGTSVPLAWKEKYPGEMQTDVDGNQYREASHASDHYLKGLGEYLAFLVNYCESQPWGERMVAYMILPYGEGCTPLTIAGKMFDCSDVNQHAFRDWVKQRYATEKALREAWQDPAVSFDSLRIPTDADWLRKKAEGPATLKGEPIPLSSLPSNANVASRGLFHWIEPANAAREHDYCRYQRQMFFRWVRTMVKAVKGCLGQIGRSRLIGFDITKQPLMGWQILSSFDGIGDGQSFPNILQLSGSWDVGELLDEDGLDFIVTPADYYARTVGFAYEAEGVTDSLVVRGKTMIVENDARCYVGAGLQDQGAFRNDTEVRAGLLRNAAFTISRGIQSYWCNVGSSYFHAPGIHETIPVVREVLDRFNTWPHRETRDAIAFVIDDESPMYEDFTSGYQTLSVIWQRVLGLAHCGVPYRIYLLSDLEKDGFPPYRVYLFPNLFKVDDATLDLLHRKVLHDGNLAIFGPATGITDGRHLGAEAATRLLGAQMELHPRSTVRRAIVQHSGHAISGELPASFTYGDGLPYGPTLTPAEWAVENAGGVPLGHANLCWFIHRTGLFLKEFGKGCGAGKSADDYGVLWSCAMPLPSALLRAAARFAGCHIWCEDDDVIYASESMASIHSVKAGPRTLKLPRACKVTDAVTGEALGDSLDRIELEIRPPETRIFMLE